MFLLLLSILLQAFFSTSSIPIVLVSYKELSRCVHPHNYVYSLRGNKSIGYDGAHMHIYLEVRASTPRYLERLHTYL